MVFPFFFFDLQTRNYCRISIHLAKVTVNWDDLCVPTLTEIEEKNRSISLIGVPKIQTPTLLMAVETRRLADEPGEIILKLIRIKITCQAKLYKLIHITDWNWKIAFGKYSIIDCERVRAEYIIRFYFFQFIKQSIYCVFCIRGSCRSRKYRFTPSVLVKRSRDRHSESGH